MLLLILKNAFQVFINMCIIIFVKWNIKNIKGSYNKGNINTFICSALFFFFFLRNAYCVIGVLIHLLISGATYFIFLAVRFILKMIYKIKKKRCLIWLYKQFHTHHMFRFNAGISVFLVWCSMYICSQPYGCIIIFACLSPPILVLLSLAYCPFFYIKWLCYFTSL